MGSFEGLVFSLRSSGVNHRVGGYIGYTLTVYVMCKPVRKMDRVDMARVGVPGRMGVCPRRQRYVHIIHITRYVRRLHAALRPRLLSSGR